jgi:hypothetical protein
VSSVDSENSGKNAGTVVAAALGNCVHVAGICGFLDLARRRGFATVNLGPAVELSKLVEAISAHRPAVVGLSYRLTDGPCRNLLKELETRLNEAGLLNLGIRYLFGGTAPTAAVASEFSFIEHCFIGDEMHTAVMAVLLGEAGQGAEPKTFARTLAGRLAENEPAEGLRMPLLRHHLGLPDLVKNLKAVREVAQAGVLDVISVAPDQNAQEFFFNPDRMRPELDGAGGVPVRSADDLSAIAGAAAVGNRPLLRCYCGTNDLLQWLFWYSTLDGRSRRDLAAAIAENCAAMAWHGERDVPVEVNDSHHWSLRDGPDAVAVAAAFLSAYNARARGVKLYVAQYMLETPRLTTPSMDAAKMLAKMDLIEGLHGPDFRTVRQLRAGLTHFGVDLLAAKGQLAASTMLAMGLRPHIIHVVGYCEGERAAGGGEIIESCKIVRGVIRNTLLGLPDAANDPRVAARRDELTEDARAVLEAIRKIGEEMGASGDPLTSAEVLTEAVRAGILDAPGLKGVGEARGEVQVTYQGGRCDAVDDRGAAVQYRKRVQELMSRRATAKGRGTGAGAGKSAG